MTSAWVPVIRYLSRKGNFFADLGGGLFTHRNKMYAKIFTSLFDGSMRGKADLILVFVNLLCHADEDGTVDRHWRAIEDETGLSHERVSAAIAELEAPDQQSRTPTNEGRRIVRLCDSRDWGWSIVNYMHYRRIQSAEQRREYMRKYQQNRRQQQPVNTSKQVLAKTTQAEAEAEAEAEADKDIVEQEFDELWKAYPSKTGKEKSLMAWRKYRKMGDTKEAALAGIARYIAFVNRRRNSGFADLKYQHGQTFFNGRGWSSEWTLDAQQPVGRKPTIAEAMAQ